jgi:hypothetical protein
MMASKMVHQKEACWEYWMGMSLAQLKECDWEHLMASMLVKHLGAMMEYQMVMYLESWRVHHLVFQMDQVTVT